MSNAVKTGMRTSVGHVQADGVNIFYREAGSPGKPVMLLLHGFPSSSFQYRNLIPLLAEKFHVIAPGFSGLWFHRSS
jgi:pimeloyl-ACP methyl ester carboxylesterase